MFWRTYIDEEKTFWHVTSFENVRSIEEKGLLRSTEGIVGAGLYALKTNYDVLEGVIEMLHQRRASEEKREEDIKLVVVEEFIYTGEYQMNPVDMLLYTDEGWY